MIILWKYKYTISAALILVVPCVLYLLVNFYWWLFDGNHLIGDKMAGAFFGGMLGVSATLLGIAADESLENAKIRKAIAAKRRAASK